MKKFKVKSNPRPFQNYVDMFKDLLDLRDEINAYDQRAINYYKNYGHHNDDFSITHVMPNSFSGEFGYLNNIIDGDNYLKIIYDTFPKDNQIMSLAKFLRAYISYAILHEANEYNIEITFSDTYNDFLENYLSLNLEIPDRLKKLTEDEFHDWIKEQAHYYCTNVLKIINKYKVKLIKVIRDYNKTFHNENMYHIENFFNNVEVKDEYFNPIINNVITPLKHFVDVWKSDKQFYKELMDYSWAEKHPEKIINDLTNIERRLNEKLNFEKYYESKLKQAAPAQEFLRINDNMSWYIIDNNKCPFEAFIGSQSSKNDKEDEIESEISSHCGHDPDADVLFSLRGKNEKGEFIHYVTAGAKKIIIDGEIKYRITQARGRRNSPIQPKFWYAMFKLYMHPSVADEINLNKNRVYKAETNFSIHWLGGLPNSYNQGVGPEELFPDFFADEEKLSQSLKMYSQYMKSKRNKFLDKMEDE
jgi:hypothetical protein